MQPAHYFKWEHLRRKGGLSKHSSKHFSRERDTRKGSTRGATKEATGTVTYWVLLRWLFAVERAVIIIDGCISWLICVMILTKQHTGSMLHASEFGFLFEYILWIINWTMMFEVLFLNTYAAYCLQSLNSHSVISWDCCSNSNCCKPWYWNCLKCIWIFCITCAFCVFKVFNLNEPTRPNEQREK